MFSDHSAIIRRTIVFIHALGTQALSADLPVAFCPFTCYHRRPLLADPQARDLFVQTLETVRQWYGYWLIGYVVTPEHAHLLLSEPERKNLALVAQM